MNELSHLATLRKQYIDLTKVFFAELQNGRSPEDLGQLRTKIESLIVDINHLEKDLNIHNGNPGRE